MTVKNIELSELEQNSNLGESLTGKNIDLIGNVKVKMQVYVGNAELEIGQLFELKEGSVISLDKSIDDPVTLILNGRVVAKGKLVAADDNFGLRITEISK